MAEVDWIDQARCPVYASFFGAMGCSVSLIFSTFGAAYGIAKSGVGVSATSVLRPDMMIRNLMPPVLSGILSIYGLVVSVIISTQLDEKSALHTNFLYLAAGFTTGLCGLAAGFCIGIVGDAGVRGTAQQPRLYIGMMLMLIFAEVLGIYGIVVGIMLVSQAQVNVTNCRSKRI